MTPKELCAELFDRAACLRVGVATDEIKTANYLDRAGMMIETLERQLAESDAAHANAHGNTKAGYEQGLRWAQEAIARHTQRKEKP